MPDWKLREIPKALKKKGFRSDSSSTRHKVFRYYHNGLKTTITTHVSHGSGKVSEGGQAFAGMKEQMHLSNKDLKRFIGCDLDGEEYERILDSLGEL